MTGQLLQQIALGGTMIVLPIYLQMVLEYNAMEAGLSLAPLSLTMFGVALLAGKRAGRRRPADDHPSGVPRASRSDSRCWSRSCRAPRTGWALAIPLVIAGAGLGLLVSQLNNYTLSPISEERVSEAAGVNSAAGSFGLSFGLAFAGAIMLATLSAAFTHLSDNSAVLTTSQQQTVSTALEDDAELMSNTQLEKQLAGQPADVKAEIIHINTDARPLALQIALLIPILAGLGGLRELVPDGAPTGSSTHGRFTRVRGVRGDPARPGRMQDRPGRGRADRRPETAKEPGT